MSILFCNKNVHGADRLSQRPVLISMQKSVRRLSALLLSASLATAAFAGSAVGGSQSLIFNITEGTSFDWQVDIGQFLSIDPVTGAINMPDTNTELTGQWGWDTLNVMNRATNQVEQRTAIKWRSTERNEDDSAWRTSFSIYATGNVDPFMTYAFAARNNTGVTQNYSMIYGESLVPPVTGAFILYADVAGSLTNAVAGPSNPFGTPTPKITPTVSDINGDGDGLAEISVLKLSTDGGVNFINAGVDVGEMLESSATTTTYGVYSATLNSSSGLPIDYWQIETKFSLTPGRDAVALSGFVELTPIPEPSTYALLLGAGSLLVAWQRRRSLAAV